MASDAAPYQNGMASQSSAPTEDKEKKRVHSATPDRLGDVEIEMNEAPLPSSAPPNASPAPNKSRLLNMNLFPEPYLRAVWWPANPNNKGMFVRAHACRQ